MSKRGRVVFPGPQPAGVSRVIGRLLHEILVAPALLPCKFGKFCARSALDGELTEAATPKAEPPKLKGVDLDCPLGVGIFAELSIPNSALLTVYQFSPPIEV